MGSANYPPRRTRTPGLMFELLRAHLGLTYASEPWGHSERNVLVDLDLVELRANGNVVLTDDGARVMGRLVGEFERLVEE